MAKALSPSLREKKRYLAYEIVTEQKITFVSARDAINRAIHDFLGHKGAAQAGTILLREKYNDQKQRGLIRTAHTSVDDIRAALCFVQEIGEERALIRSVGCSGILKKAYEKYIAN